MWALHSCNSWLSCYYLAVSAYFGSLTRERTLIVVASLARQGFSWVGDVGRWEGGGEVCGSGGEL